MLGRQETPSPLRPRVSDGDCQDIGRECPARRGDEPGPSRGPPGRHPIEKDVSLLPSFSLEGPAQRDTGMGFLEGQDREPEKTILLA